MTADRRYRVRLSADTEAELTRDELLALAAERNPRETGRAVVLTDDQGRPVLVSHGRGLVWLDQLAESGGGLTVTMTVPNASGRSKGPDQLVAHAELLHQAWHPGITRQDLLDWDGWDEAGLDTPSRQTLDRWFRCRLGHPAGVRCPGRTCPGNPWWPYQDDDRLP